MSFKKKIKLLKKVSKFCHEELDEDCEEEAIELLEFLSDMEKNMFSRGKLNVWASAIIYIACLNCEYSDEKILSKICKYFDVKESSIMNRVSKIQEKLEDFDDNAFFDDVYRLYENGQSQKALEKLDLIEKDDPDYPKALFYKSTILDESGDLDEARELFDDALMLEYQRRSDVLEESVDENDPMDLFVFANLCYENKDFDKSLKYLDKSLKLDPRQSEVFCLKAMNLIELEEFDEALAEIDKAIKLESDNPAFWSLKGNISSFKDLNGDALECFDKALEIDSDFFDAIIFKIQLYLHLGDFDKACDLCDNFPEKYSDEIDYLKVKAQLLLFQQKFGEALEVCDKCLKIDDELAEFWLYKGICHAQIKGDDDKYRHAIDMACELDPQITFRLLDFINDEGDFD